MARPVSYTHLDVYKRQERVNVNDALIKDARLSVELSDTVPPDTTPSTNFWKINKMCIRDRDTRNPARICRDHPVRLNTPVRPIANEYCEGTVSYTHLGRPYGGFVG